MRLVRAISLIAWLSCIAASNAAAAPPGINLSGATAAPSGRTIGANACAGCMDQADIVLTSIKLTMPYNPGTGTYPRDVLLTQPSTRNYVSWRPGVVATRNASWGAIKSMYR